MKSKAILFTLAAGFGLAGPTAAQQKEVLIGMQCDRTGATQITSVVLCPAMHDYYDLTNAGGGVEGYSLLCRPILEGGAEPVRRSRQAPALHLPNRCGVDPKPCRAEPKFRIRPSPAKSLRTIGPRRPSRAPACQHRHLLATFCH